MHPHININLNNHPETEQDQEKSYHAAQIYQITDIIRLKASQIR